MDIVSDEGRTSTVYRVKVGLVVKSPRVSTHASVLAEIKDAFPLERQLLERLGIILISFGVCPRPRIVAISTCCSMLIRDDRYYGLFRTSEDMPDGFLLEGANCGDLESYIDSDCKMDDALRQRWSLQIDEAVAHVHKKGIIHSNLSTTNVLVH
jgi:hypothetical protein